MRHLRAIVFDFDGVLADTEPLHLEAFRQALAPDDVTIDRDEYYARYLGRDDLTVIGVVAEDRGLRLTDREVLNRVAEKTRIFEHLLDAGSPLMPGAAACLGEWCSLVPIAIASGALRSEIERVIGSAGLASAVEAIVAAGETPRGKPAPDPFRRAVELLEANRLARAGGLDQRESAPISASRTVAVEDSPAGVASAKAAGLVTVALTTSRDAADLAGADLVVAGLAALSLEALDALVASVATGRPPGR